MTEDIINLLFNSGKVKDSEEWDAIYQDDLPIGSLHIIKNQI